MTPKYILLDRRHTVTESLISDGTTFGLLILCIYISQGSRWWTFFTAVMCILWVFAKLSLVSSTRQKKFKSLDEIEEWVAQEKREQ